MSKGAGKAVKGKPDPDSVSLSTVVISFFSLIPLFNFCALEYLTVSLESMDL